MPEDLPTSAQEPASPLTYGPPIPPPAGRTSPWVWVALALSIASIVLTAASPLLMFGMDFMLDEDLEGEPISEESGYYVDQRSVVRAVEEPCNAMAIAGEKIRIGGPAAESSASLHAWSDAAQGIVDAIEGVDPDKDSRAWRDDWKATIRAVDRFADNFGKPKNRLHLPASAEDMSWATDVDCPLPIAVVGLDPDNATMGYGE